MKKKRALGGPAPPPHKHHKGQAGSGYSPVTPDARRNHSGDIKKPKHGHTKKGGEHAGGGGRPGGPPLPLPWPALQRPLTSQWWPGASDFEPSPDEEDEDAPVPLPPQPQPLTVAAPADSKKAFPCLEKLATSAGPPGGPTAGRAVLAALIAPVSVDTFLSSVFEGRPLLVRGRGASAAASYSNLFSSRALNAWVDTGAALYGTALDVVRYDGALRHTLNYNDEDAGDEPINACADPGVFKRRLEEEGCSARVLHPQRWSPALAAVLCALEGFFGCLVGCNAYLTPSGGAQGFAPHADGVGVFILQAEGRKRWRLHGPRAPPEVLPLASSPDFGPGEVGPVVLDTVLEEGDLLYLPRGMVHQAETPPAAAGGGGGPAPTPPPSSLPLTISVSDGLTGGGTWAELLATALPRALELAASRCVGLRKALPPGVVAGALGVGVEDSGARAEGAKAASGPPAASAAAPYAARVALRTAAQATAARALAAVMAAFPLDAAADAVAADFIRRRLPPPRPAGCGDGGATPVPVTVRPVAEGTAARLVIEEGAAVVYHCMQNDVSAHAEGGGDGSCSSTRGRLALPLECAPAVEALLGLHSPTPGSAVALADIIEEMGGGAEAAEVVGVAAGEMWAAGLLERAW